MIEAMRAVLAKADADTYRRLVAQRSAGVPERLTIDVTGKVVSERKEPPATGINWVTWCSACEKALGPKGFKTWEQAKALLELHRGDCPNHPPDCIELHCFTNFVAETG